jgi:hypothetical protein
MHAALLLAFRAAQADEYARPLRNCSASTGCGLSGSGCEDGRDEAGHMAVALPVGGAAPTTGLVSCVIS